jgi:hypothetical protein
MAACCCPYPDNRQSHPLFVYLTSDSRFTTDKNTQWIVPFIGMAENPFDDIRRQNREPNYTGADHTTKSGSGFIQLEMVIGPFPFTVASAFRDEWRRSSRKLYSRVKTGVDQAVRYSADGIYCRDVGWARQRLDAARKQSHSGSRKRKSADAP